MRSVRSGGVALILVITLASCSTGSSSTTTTGRPNTTTSAAPGTYVPGNGAYSGLVAISKSRNIYLECRGSRSPTVVFISGRSDRAKIWQTLASGQGGSAVYPGTAEFTRVCAYDRPGTVTITGDRVEATSSTPVPQPTTAADGVADLHALLKAAKVPGPYVLVAHSWGGMIARLYASTYPRQVSGMVLVDALTELLYYGLTPQERTQWIAVNSQYSPDLDPYHQEETNIIPSMESLLDAPSPPPMPVVMLASDQPYDLRPLAAEGRLPPGIPLDLGPVFFQAHIAGQKLLAERLDALLILDTHAGHYIQTEQPQLVINSVRHVVDEVRKVPDPKGMTLSVPASPGGNSQPEPDDG